MSDKYARPPVFVSSVHAETIVDGSRPQKTGNGFCLEEGNKQGKFYKSPEELYNDCFELHAEGHDIYSIPNPLGTHTITIIFIKPLFQNSRWQIKECGLSTKVMNF